MSAGNAPLEKSLIDTISATAVRERYAKSGKVIGQVKRSTPAKPKYPTDKCSMLEGSFNLSCQAGHRAFSPTPEGWYGMECYIGNCHLLQHPLTPDGKILPIPGRHTWRTIRR